MSILITAIDCLHSETERSLDHGMLGGCTNEVSP